VPRHPPEHADPVLTSQKGWTRRRVRPLSAANSLRASAVATSTLGTALVVAPGAVAGDGAFRPLGAVLIVVAFVFAAASRWPASMMQRPVLLAAAVVASGGAVTVFLTTATLTGVPAAAILVESALAAWLWGILITDRV